MKVAFLDFETTGLNVRQNHVIEGAVILMEYDEEYNLKGVADFYSSFNDPGYEIPEFIVNLTNITTDLVKSHKLNWDKFNGICEKADVLIAHNMKFDKQWLRQHGKFKNNKKYGCSLDMIEWKHKHGQSCAKLQHLAFEHGIFAKSSHRAIDDVKLMIKLLKQQSKGNKERTYFQELMANLNDEMFKVYAWKAPFDNKDELKKIGFRWNQAIKCWWRDVPKSLLKETEDILKSKVYNNYGNKKPEYEVKKI